MGEAQGRKELTDVVLAAVALANASVAAAKDGKLGLDDLGAFVGAVPKVVAAVDGIDKLPAEVLDLSGEEGAALVADVAAALALGDEKARKVVLASLKTLVGVKDIVVALTEAPAAPVAAEPVALQEGDAPQGVTEAPQA